MLPNLCHDECRPADRRQRPDAGPQPQFYRKAKRVIHIFSQGAPSHLDTWDHKPALAKHADQNESDRRSAVARTIRIQENGPERHACERVFDQIGQHVDDIAVINSMHTNIRLMNLLR